jgi:glycosyltransferase involved in cell wall biosynthesis
MEKHTKEYIKSVKDNFHFIYKVIHPSGNLTLESSELTPTVDSFLKSSKGLCSEKQAAVFVFLALFLRYPFPHELNATLFGLRFDGLENTLNYLFRSNLGAIGSLDYIARETLLVDVSHTKKYKHNSGIQRVVRSLCSALWKKKKNIAFIHWNESMQPMRVDEDEIDFVVGWSNSSRGKKGVLTTKRWKLRLAFVSTLINRIILLPVISILPATRFVIKYVFNNTNLGITILSKLDAIKSKKSSPLGLLPLSAYDTNYKRPKEKTLLFFKSNLLVPELTCEGYRYEPTFVVRDADLTQLGYIVYDLIPVFNPEFCVSTIRAEFNQYLKLLRYADKISCISQTVQDEVKSIETCIVRVNKNPLKKETHLLAGDFNLDIPVDNSMGQCIPNDGLDYILAVGTLEPRKNGLAVLRACISAMKNGHKFRLIFAGNPGWLAEELLENIHKFQKQGFPILAFSSVSEGALKYLYQNSKFTLFCSLAEGFGLPILESLHYKKPVITSRRGSMKELAQSFGGCVLVDPIDVDDISKNIIQLLSDQNLYNKLKTEAQNVSLPTWDEYSETIYSYFA